MNKKTLIIPDIHLKIDLADKIIKNVDHDEVIFLGDLFDDFNDTPEMIQNACDWLVEFVNNPNHTMILGNHDMHYAFTNKSFQCSGYEQWKYFIIHDNLSHKKVWDKIKHYHILDNKWLLTHAGLHKHLLPSNIANLYPDRESFLKEVSKYLDKSIIDGFRNEGWIFEAGTSRGGFQRFGGITWCDHNQDMYPILGLNQIYGHTPQSRGDASWIIQDSEKSDPYFKPSFNQSVTVDKINNVNSSYNLCLDVWKNMHYAVWDGKKMIIHSHNTLV